MWFHNNWPSHLTLHKQSKHEGIEYHCDQCQYAVTCSSILKMLKELKHEGQKYLWDKFFKLWRFTSNQSMGKKISLWPFWLCSYRAMKSEEALSIKAWGHNIPLRPMCLMQPMLQQIWKGTNASKEEQIIKAWETKISLRLLSHHLWRGTRNWRKIS